MANVRCPMCSKINSPEAEVCAFCGARLKPLGVSSAKATPPVEPEKPQTGDESDWLSSLRSPDPAEETSPDEQAGVPDWLSRIRTRAKSDTDQPDDIFGREEEDQSDWMSGLKESESPPEEAGQPSSPLEEAQQPAGGSGEDDWFARLGGRVETPAEEQQPDQDFGWLDRFNPSADQQPDQKEEGRISSGTGVTEFLSNLEGRSGKPDQAPEAEEAAFGDLFAPEEPQESSRPDETLTGFSPTGEQDDQSQFEWMGEAGTNGLPGEPARPDASQETADISAWLAGLDAQAAAGRQESTQPSAASPEDLPDWLKGGFDEQPPQPAASLEVFEGEQPVLPPLEPAQEIPAAAVPSETGDLEQPDWQGLFQGEELPPVGEQPEGLALSATEQIPAEEAPFPMFDAAPVEPAAAPAPFIDSEAPSWLRDFAAPEPPESETGVPVFVEMEPAQASEPGAEEPFAADLPQWLEEENAPQEAEAAVGLSEAAPAGEDLARAELPTWVAAMRPVETILSDDTLATESDQRTEKAGPLAGLRGVLPVAENIFRYRKPPIYSAKLRVSEKQRTQASLLESILAQETQPLLVTPRGVHAPRLILRILVALVLVFTLLVPSFLGDAFAPLSQPVLYPAELINMFQQIDQNLSQEQQSTVLLAVDYEPGLSGEMNAAAAPVISHLMAKNARIVIISTTPTGPILADQLLRQVSGSSAPGYGINDQVVNLGYLPGGMISMLEFIQQPRLAAPAALSGDLAWQATFLSSIVTFQDFAQVIVLTDTAETGRAWVEQISPNMGSVPLFMVASAQAAPLLVPYLSADIGQPGAGDQVGGQIDGMVSGLMGGAQYGWVAQQVNNPASRYWASYQVGIVLAIVLILAGGLYSGIKRLLGSSEKDEA